MMAILPIIAGSVLLRSSALIAASAGVAVGLTAGMLSAPVTPYGLFDDRLHTLSGVIESYAELDGAGSAIIRIDSCDATPCREFRISAYIPATEPEIDDTYRLRFRATIEPLTSKTDLPDEADHSISLRRQGVTAGSFINPNSIDVYSPVNGFLPSLRRTRHKLARAIALSPVNDSTGAFLIATLTGDRDLIQMDVRTTFSTVGLAHLLALSGLHVAIITGVVGLCMLPLVIIRRRKWAMVLTVIAMWLFAVMTGMTPSVVRAVIMGSLLMSTLMLERHPLPLNTLSAAAIILLLFSPRSLFSAGFQLSFLAVLSILVFARPLTPKRGHPLLRAIGAYFAVTVSATLGTGIWSTALFGVFPLWFIPANIIASFIIAPLIVSGMVTLLLTFAGLPAWLPAICADFLYSLLSHIASSLSQLPILRISFIPATAIVVYFAVLTMLAALIITRRKVWLISAALTLLFGIALLIVIPRPIYPTQELFIPSASPSTMVLIREGATMRGFTTTHPTAITPLRTISESRYSAYMAYRGIDSIPITRVPGISIIRFGETTFMIAGKASAEVVLPTRPDYLLLSGHYSGNALRLIEAVEPDSVLIASDVAPARRDKWLREFSSAGIRARSLHESGFRISQ